MAPNEAVSSVLSKYATFSGRARRSEFWFWVLAVWVLNIVLGILINVSSAFLIIDGLIGLALVVPYLAVGTRRLHDSGKSGLWWLIALTVVGFIVLIIFWAQDSSAENQYGPSPKAVPAYAG